MESSSYPLYVGRMEHLPKGTCLPQAITTRFPALALTQFQQEKDYADWANNLDVYGLDLCNLKAVEDFIIYYQSKQGSLDILINNAAQTIKYTDEYYLPLVQQEQKLLSSFQENKQVTPFYFFTNPTFLS